MTLTCTYYRSGQGHLRSPGEKGQKKIRDVSDTIDADSVCMDVCQFPLAAYYERVARARMVKFSYKIRQVQPFVVLKFRVCAINGVHVRGASLPHFGSGRRRRRVTRAELRFLAVKTERFIPDIFYFF